MNNKKSIIFAQMKKIIISLILSIKNLYNIITHHPIAHYLLYFLI